MQNNPIRYIDPSGHIRVDNEGGGGTGCTNTLCLPTPPNNLPGSENFEDKRKPGDPLCKGQKCDDIRDGLTNLAYKLDTWAFNVSAAEAGVASLAYTGATVACLVSELAACAPAYKAAFAIDTGSARTLSFIEDYLGYASAIATFSNDVLSGNFGVDKEIGPYAGKDTIVAVRNSVLGSVPESYLDFAVSASQLEYDKDRISGEKAGGYVPVFSLEFVVQILIKDWW